jgi:hypothetical protein
MGLGLIKGIGASLEVDDDGGGVKPESGFKDDVSTLGPLECFSRIAGGALTTFRPSTRDADPIGEIGEDRGEDSGEGERGTFGTSGGVKASSLESDADPGDFGSEGCGLLNPLASADSRSPNPRDTLRGRAVGESALATSDESFNGSEVRIGRLEFPPTSSPISMSGFAGRRAGEPGAGDIALP